MEMEEDEETPPSKKKRKRASSGISEGAKSDTTKRGDPADMTASCGGVAMESEVNQQTKKKKKKKKSLDFSTQENKEQRLEFGWGSIQKFEVIAIMWDVDPAMLAFQCASRHTLQM